MTHIEFQRSAINGGDCIGNAWGLVTGKIGLYIGIGVVTMLMIGCIPILNMFLMGPVLGGFYYVVLRDMRGESVDFGMMFKGFEKFVPLMVIGLIQSIPGVIVQVLQYTVDIARLMGVASSGSGTFYQSNASDFRVLEGLSIAIVIVALGLSLFAIVWNLAFQFAIPLVLEHDLSVGEAIKTSVSAAMGNTGGMIVLLILGILVGIVGVLAICLGLLVAIPVIYAANAFAYRQVFPLIEQNFNFSPPPPTAYSGNFGNPV